VSGPTANQGTVYVVAGSSGWATFRWGYHPAMFFDELEMGSLVLDINGNRLDATFLRETGAIDDTFSIIKGDPDPFRFYTFVVQDGQVSASWKSHAGQRYQIERTDNLETPDWQPVGDPITANDIITTWADVLPSNTTRGFYRVANLGM
jgi:hypothetical protein